MKEGGSRGNPGFPRALSERLARLEQRLQAAQHALQAVVRDREQARAVVLIRDLPRDPARLLRDKVRVVERAPLVHEPARRVELEHGPVAPGLAVGPIRLVVVRRPLDPGPVEVAGRELRRRDRLPDLLRGGLDEDLVDLRRLCGGGCHALSSSSLLRSASAATRCSVNLSIQRSWISRIGTGFRKWSFSRPCLRATTSPASSRRRRCFITPKRVISSSDSSSVSVRPSRSKSRSRRWRRVGSASALKTWSSSSTPRIIG